MLIGVPTETVPDETRVALIPPKTEDLIEDGHEVCVQTGAGAASDWTDADYREAGCEVVDDRETVFERADVVVQVRALAAAPGDDVDPYREGQIVVGLLGPYDLDEELGLLADRGVSAFALELLPRISRAQSMDALSSMSSIGGYESAVVAAKALPKMFPLQMTAAGTVQPAEVFVIGAGVAGLQAIATADRVVVVPGYGMAVAQAQHAVAELSELLDEAGVEVEFGIHPVAGRMPGHMNVLLAEADVPSDKMKELEEINPTFSQTDVVIVTGANDVVNPRANEADGSPISGMPVLNVGEAGTVVVNKRSLSPGFSGIPNPLFAQDNTVMLFGDGKETVQEVVNEYTENR